MLSPGPEAHRQKRALRPNLLSQKSAARPQSSAGNRTAGIKLNRAWGGGEVVSSRSSPVPHAHDEPVLYRQLSTSTSSDSPKQPIFNSLPNNQLYFQFRVYLQFKTTKQPIFKFLTSRHLINHGRKWVRCARHVPYMISEERGERKRGRRFRSV